MQTSVMVGVWCAEHGSERRDRQTLANHDHKSLFLLLQKTSSHRKLPVQVRRARPCIM